MFGKKPKQQPDPIVVELLKLLRNLDSRLLLMEKGHNELIEAVNKLGEEMWLDWDGTHRRWLEVERETIPDV